MGSVSGLVTAGTGTFTLGSGEPDGQQRPRYHRRHAGGLRRGHRQYNPQRQRRHQSFRRHVGWELRRTGGNWTGTGIVTGLATASTGTFTLGSGANLTTNSGLAITGGTLAGSRAVAGNTTLSGNGASIFPAARLRETSA